MKIKSDALKPKIRVYRDCIGEYRYKHVGGDLSLITESDTKLKD